MKGPKDKRGVSPVIGIILMVAIVIILAGVVTIWVTTITSESNDDDQEMAFFNIYLDPDDDTITLLYTRGEEEINSIKYSISIESTTLDLPDDFSMKVGEEETLDISGQIDLERDHEYRVSITNSSKGEVIYTDEIIAR